MRDYKLPYKLMIKSNEFYFGIKANREGLYTKARLLGDPPFAVTGAAGYWSYAALQFLE